MKNLRIKAGAFPFDELSVQVRRHYHLRYNVTDNGRNEIIIAKDASIGCKVLLTQKRMMIHGTFATPGKMLLAFFILVLGGIIVPMLIYMIAYKGKFEAMEKEVYQYIVATFPDRLIT